MQFNNTYARELEGAYAPWQPAQAPRPRELFFNFDLAAELSPDLSGWPLEDREAVFSGNRVPEGAQPIAQAYAGHQFGGFSPQLGDGRALLLGEVLDTRGQRRDIAFKGSGRTPFSRGGDGKAAVGPMLREVLIGEALHAMGIPTTRALAVVATGDGVFRERMLPGAVLTRVASSHLRVGTFEFFAARGDAARLQRLLSYALTRHGDGDEAATPSEGSAVVLAAAARALERQVSDTADPAVRLLVHVAQRQASLVAQWMGVGFIHGVMNTDNMSISGQSIDFGPCAFMEAHDPATVYSSIDRQGRYAYGNQPMIAQWNLARLADALWPVMQGTDEDKLAAAQPVVQGFEAAFEAAMAVVWSRKLGWEVGQDKGIRSDANAAFEAARELALNWQSLMHQHRVDHTLGWRSLLAVAQGRSSDAVSVFQPEAERAVHDWLASWQAASSRLGLQVATELLQQANPRVVPRNHQVEAALAAASDEGDLSPFNSLLSAVRRPFDEDEALAAYAQPAPPEIAAGHRTFCGT